MPSASGSSSNGASYNGNGHANGVHNGHGRVRVLLVGRTGQDAVLRHDPDVELIRAYHPLGAIGEMASPMDSETPEATTVIVGQGVVSEERARSFVTALRRIDSNVRVLAISSENLPVYDGTVPPDIAPEALRRLVHASGGSERGEGAMADGGRGGDEEMPSAERDAESIVDALLGGPSDTRDDGSRSADRRDEGFDGSTYGDGAAGRDAAGDDEPVRTRLTLVEGDGLGLDDEDGDDEGREIGQPGGGVREGSEAGVHAPIAEPDAESPGSSGSDEESGRSPTGRFAAAFDDRRRAQGPSVSAFDPAPAIHVLAGDDPVPAVLSIIRKSSGVDDLQYIAHEEGGQAPDTAHIKVMHHGGVLGYVVSPGGGAGGNLTRVTPEHLEFLRAWAALARHETQLREYAFSDELTGAFNRRFFNRFMEGAIEQAKETRQYLTILYFDIDDFKLYNDRFGHGAGDEILQETVALLKSVIRPSDKVCRLGGDEFAVIFYDPGMQRTLTESGALPPASESPARQARAGAAPQSIAQLAERFQKQICSHRFPKLGEAAPGTLTISGGMATYPWDGRSTEELLARADELLLQSKAQGKNLITFGPGSEQVCRTM